MDAFDAGVDANDFGLPDASDLGADAADLGDAGTPGVCPAPEVIDPARTTTSLTWTAAGRYDTRACTDTSAWTCVGLYEVAQFTISSPMQFTTWIDHGAGGSFGEVGMGIGLSTDCSVEGPSCLGREQYPRILSLSLGPGTYEVSKCKGLVTYLPSGLAIEPPLTAPTNTSCATAAPFPARQARVLTSGPFYYRWDSPTFGGPPTPAEYFYLSSGTRIGVAHLSLQTTCDDLTSEIASSDFSDDHDFPGSGSDIVAILAAHPASTYYVVVSGVTPGLEFAIDAEPYH